MLPKKSFAFLIDQLLINLLVSFNISMAINILHDAPQNFESLFQPTLYGWIIALLMAYLLPLPKIGTAVGNFCLGSNSKYDTMIGIVLINVVTIVFILTMVFGGISWGSVMDWLSSLPFTILTGTVVVFLFSGPITRFASLFLPASKAELN